MMCFVRVRALVRVFHVGALWRDCVAVLLGPVRLCVLAFCICWVFVSLCLLLRLQRKLIRAEATRQLRIAELKRQASDAA